MLESQGDPKVLDVGSGGGQVVGGRVDPLPDDTVVAGANRIEEQRPPGRVAESKARKRGTGRRDLGTIERRRRMPDAARVDEERDAVGPLPDVRHLPVAVLGAEGAERDDRVRGRRATRRLDPDDEHVDRPAVGSGAILEDGQVAARHLEDDLAHHVIGARRRREARPERRDDARTRGRRRATAREGSGRRRRLGRAGPDGEAARHADRHEPPKARHVTASGSRAWSRTRPDRSRQRHLQGNP